MEESGKLGYKKCSPLYEASVSKSDGYNEVVSKLCTVLDVQEDEEEMKLFTAGGSVIPKSEMTVGTKIVPWTIGSYLNKRRISPDKLKLGVGPVDCSSDLKRSTQPSKKRRIEVDLHVCSSTAKPREESIGECTR